MEELVMVVRVQRYPFPAFPFESIFDIERDVNHLFGNPGVARRHHPALDVAGYENESVVVAELPGVQKEDIKISMQDGMLTISGVRKEMATPESSTWLRNEIRTGEFSRTVQLPHEVDADGIVAELTNGVLRIVLPKAAEARPHEIRVK